MWEMYILISRRLLEIGPGTGTDGSHKTVRTAQDRLLHATYGINYFHMPSHKYEDLDNQVFKCDHVVALWWPADEKQLFSFIGPYTVRCTSSTVLCTDRCTTTLYILLNSGCSFRLVCIHQPHFFFSFFFAILEILANFCTQRKKNHSNLEYFIKKFQRKIPIFSKRKRKILSEKNWSLKPLRRIIPSHIYVLISTSNCPSSYINIHIVN